MWFLLLLLYTAHDQLLTQGEDRIFLKNGSNPCEGYIGIYHNDTLGYVGEKYWSNNTEKVVCESTHCGERISSSSRTAPWPVDKLWINEVKCKGNESDLWECDFPGWGASQDRKDSLRKIKCSHNINVSMDGFQCAGAVQYSTNGGETYSGYFCADNWGKDEANLLCEELKCGLSKEIVKQPWMGWKGFKAKRSKTMTVDCSDNKHFTNLWQCATQETPSCQNPVSVICKDHESVQLKGNTSNVCSGRLQKEENGVWSPVPWTVQNNKNTLDEWCKQMHCGTSDVHSQEDNGIQLTCSDDVKVVLMDKNNEPSRCYGKVYVAVNGTSHPVCASNWNDNAAEVICSELNCGSVLKKSEKPINEQGIMDNVMCSGKESSLWHCRAKRDHRPFPCSTTAYVVCKDSINVRLMDGPEKCAGRVEIQHEGEWQRVSDQGWTDINSDTICSMLNCGTKRNSINVEKFSQGSGIFLPYGVDCKKNDKHISDCYRDRTINTLEKAMGITCAEHKMVFLKGNQSCSGMVGIEQGNKTYWLSGSDKAWNIEAANTVCKQMHCGNALQHSSIPRDMLKSLWNESYSCSSDTKSLFDCKKLPSERTDPIATVTCLGNITVKLTNECWGNVIVSLDDKYGGVCADAWTEQNSKMLCENLGCGRVLQATNQPKESKVIVKSVHATNETTLLSQCNFITSDDNDNTCKPAYVVCSDSVKAKFSPSRDKCSGNVEVRYDGQWLPVCEEALKDIPTQNTICEELKCGQASKPIGYFGPKEARGRAISQIQCSVNDKSLAACTINYKEGTCTTGGLQCSGWSKMALTVNKACSGDAVVYSEGKISAISLEGWTETEGDRLCQDLNCGNVKSNKTTMSDLSWTTNFSCAVGKVPDNIWDCEKTVYPSQESQSKLFIECQDEPNVTLSERCYGELKINDIEVCDSHWKESDSHMVCQERNCGNAIASSSHVKDPFQDKKYHHVSCEDNHYKLGQCKRFKGKCSGHLVSVYCVDKVEFNTTEKCGGQIEVNYRGKWEKVCPLKAFPLKHLEKLCKELGCDGHNADIRSQNTDNLVSLETSLSCTNDDLDMKYCLTHKSCDKDKVKPAEIYCNGYTPRPSKPVEDNTTPIWPKLLGVGLVLVLVILIVVFIRICIIKNGQNISRMLSRKEVAFESGDYDDVMNKSNEMEELNHDRFRSESEVTAENDAQSSSSFPYDDIDDLAAAQPLTSQAATADASGEGRIHEGAPEQSADGATYEVEEQVSYDDIEASPEIPQTEAEVHGNTQTTPESDAEAPVESGQGGEDYLVPRPVSQN